MSNVMDENDGGESRTDIDPYANMVVVGKNATILANTWNRMDVIPFIKGYQDLQQVSIVDEAVQYTCQ